MLDKGKGSTMVAVRTTFDKQLNALQDNVLRIAEMVNTQLMQAVKALQTGDTALAQRVADFDATINNLRYETEEQAYTLMALQQPNARDMRHIVATVSVVTNLERMGDHAAGIARLALRMAKAECHVTVPEFDKMAQVAAASLDDAMKALVSDDKVLARAVVNNDAQIDELHKSVYDHLVQGMTNDPSTIECATMSLWVSHNLERFSDRISNICERIVYLITGELFEIRADTMP
jgi:phosphate transport system protein